MTTTKKQKPKALSPLYGMTEKQREALWNDLQDWLRGKGMALMTDAELVTMNELGGGDPKRKELGQSKDQILVFGLGFGVDEDGDEGTSSFLSCNGSEAMAGQAIESILSHYPDLMRSLLPKLLMGGLGRR